MLSKSCRWRRKRSPDQWLTAKWPPYRLSSSCEQSSIRFGLSLDALSGSLPPKICLISYANKSATAVIRSRSFDGPVAANSGQLPWNVSAQSCTPVALTLSTIRVGSDLVKAVEDIKGDSPGHSIGCKFHRYWIPKNKMAFNALY